MLLFLRTELRQHAAVTMIERTTRMAALRGLFGYAASRGVDINELCGSLGLEPTDFERPLQTVPFTITRRAWLAVIERLPHENIAVGAATSFRIEDSTYAGMFLTQARNGIELLQLLVDASNGVSDTALIDDPVTLTQRNGHVEVRLPAVLSDGIPERSEAALLASLTCLRRLGLPTLTPTRVHAIAEWSEKRALVEPHYRCRVRWGAGEDLMCFEHEALLQPLAAPKPGAADEFRAFVANEANKRPTRSFPERVRQAFQQQLRAGNSTQQATARALGMSARSLQRKLAESGLNFAKVREEALQQRAAQLLRDDSYTVEQIALHLGYSEPRSFSRLWKRLTGDAPGHHRARLRGRL